MCDTYSLRFVHVYICFLFTLCCDNYLHLRRCDIQVLAVHLCTYVYAIPWISCILLYCFISGLQTEINSNHARESLTTACADQLTAAASIKESPTAKLPTTDQSSRKHLQPLQNIRRSSATTIQSRMTGKRTKDITTYAPAHCYQTRTGNSYSIIQHIKAHATTYASDWYAHVV